MTAFMQVLMDRAVVVPCADEQGAVRLLLLS